MGCGDSKTSTEKQIDLFLKMIKSMPSMRRYPYNKTNVANFTRAWASRQFGGNVLSDLGAPKARKNKKTPLEPLIKNAQLNALYGGGYYVLENVQQFEDNEQWFYDIYILIEKSENMDHMKQVKELHEKYQQSLLKKGKSMVNTTKVARPDYVKFDDIKESLTGFARMVSYKNHSDGPNSLYYELDSVVEGQFKEGKRHGFCRGITAIDGSCAVGFHEDGAPKGKWCSYRPNGDFAKPEGLYDGTTCTKQITIQNYLTKITK